MNPIYEKFTTHLKRTIREAVILAQKKNSATVLPADLLEALIRQRGSIGAEVLWKSGLKVQAETATLEDDAAAESLPVLSSESLNILVKAALVASKHYHRYIGTEHLLWGLLEMDITDVATLMQKYQLQTQDVKKHLGVVLKSTSKFPDITRMFSKNPEVAEQQTREQESIVEFFATDLCDPKLQKKIDPVIGRNAEIERVIHILSRRNKNNPLLIGDTGVGKTAIVEGLAKKIMEGNVPPVLQNRRILNLDLSLVVAGTMYRGEFENRIKHILDEIKQNPDIILFIDEVHTLIGAGSTSGSMDAANILKPALAKGEISVIGATTFEEYHKYIESDSALERRFQPVIVDELTDDDSIEVLRGIKKNYEQYHHVKISDEAVVAAVRLSSRYIQDRHLPDKAIDLLDEACSKLKVHQEPDPLEKTIRHLGKDLKMILEAKDQAIYSERFNDAMKLKEKEHILQTKIRELDKQRKNREQRNLGEITSQDIAAVVARITHIPLEELTTNDRERLLHLEEELSAFVAGQKEAVQQVAAFIKRSRAGLTDPLRPTASFMFLGPSGVGKTELAKVIARTVFEDDKALIRIDMSEFSESFQASKLIGAPAGYVGYKDGGKLTESVKRKPYSVVLFDEIEKAHPEIFNLLLQILEDGQLTDATGKVINFKNTIIIMTSNVGLDSLQSGANMGFEAKSSSEKKRAQEAYEEMKSRLMDELKDTFRPEFLNRLDRIVVFEPLGKEAVTQIVKIQLNLLAKKLDQQNMHLQFQPSAVSYVAQHGFSPEHGAREIRRVIQQDIEHPLADAILEGRFRDGSTVTVQTLRGKMQFTES